MQCKFEKDWWRCPLSAEDGEEFCYWHLPKDGKSPDEEKLKELKENIIRYAYLAHADLSGKDLSKAYLGSANLQGANLREANLQGANLECANLQESNLLRINLQKADLKGANLQGANLRWANLQDANLLDTNLQGTDLRYTNLQGAILNLANLQEADLRGANFQKAHLSCVNLRQANLVYARANSETILDEADLRFANIYLSYLDETKSLRNAMIGKYDINEILADLMGKNRYVFLDCSKIKDVKPEITLKMVEFAYFVYHRSHHGIIYDEAIIDTLLFLPFSILPYYVSYSCGIGVSKKIVIFDKKEKKVVRLDFDDKGKLRKEHVEIPELNELIEGRLDEFTLLKDKEEIKEFRAYLYDCAYEVYNSLYYFYIQSGKLDEALEMHYRRSEARRKALKLKGRLNWLRSWIYDFFILKTLTGYGIKIWRPLVASLIIILIYAFLFWLTNGIVKVVNGKEVNPDFIDYLYHSIITFTSLGYANIQPNLSVGHVPQILAASESCLGTLMIALLIFTITFRVSR